MLRRGRRLTRLLFLGGAFAGILPISLPPVLFPTVQGELPTGGLGYRGVGFEKGSCAVAAVGARSYAQRMGIVRSMVVQELGWDNDTDDDIGSDIEDAIGTEMVDDETDGVVDVVLLWWRLGDGDLADELRGMVEPLSDLGVVWVLTPQPGRPGHVDQSEIAEEAHAAGLATVGAVDLGAWSGNCLGRPTSSSARR
jgi:DUF3052 family protein